MTPHATTHVTDDELILRYYGEPYDAERVEPHLAACAPCRDSNERLKRMLGLVDGDLAPEPPPHFEVSVWARLEPQLPRRLMRTPPAPRRALPRWVLAGGMAALLVLAFVVGRVSSPTGPATPAPATTVTGDPMERMLVFAVVDHLDRSQVMLLELVNADPDGPALDLASERARARELVAENRLYRLSALQMGDRPTSEVLDELERTLLELANAPPDATTADLAALRSRIAARGLLFKVRVVHSEMQQREREAMMPRSVS